MKINDYLPAALLRPFILTYRIIESQRELVNRVLPNTSLAVAFRCMGQTSYLNEDSSDNLAASTISGLRKSVRLINYSKDAATIVVLFKEMGAKAFFKEPLHELFEESVSLDHFIKQQKISIIEDQLAEAKTNSQRIAIVEEFLLSLLSESNPDKLISTSLDIINATNGNIRIKELAGRLFISNDAFEKRFRKIIGTSPKTFSSIVRMRSIVNKGKTSQRLTDMVYDAGYFDQPHFNKDFKLFTGQTPSIFFKSPSFW